MGGKRNYRYWTTKEIDFLISHCGEMSIMSLTELFNRRFPGYERTNLQVYETVHRYNGRIGRKAYRRYTKDETRWLMEHIDLSPDELGRQFRLEFKNSRSNHGIVDKRNRIRRGMTA